MGSKRRNGVEAAIALLAALNEMGGAAGKAELTAAIGLPRASFHRIVMTLAATGLIELSRGRVRAGPALDALLHANAAAMHDDDAQRRQRGQRRAERPALPETVPGSTLPIALTPPCPRHRRGRLRIGFSNASMDNPWRVALVHSIEYAAANIGDRIEWLAVRHAGDDPSRRAHSALHR